jgi:hypothetical protein
MPNAPPERIFVSSARVSDAEIGESKRSGCDEFMPKPVQVEALLAQMERHLGLEWIRGTSQAGAVEQGVGAAQTAGPVVPPSVDERTRLLELAEQGSVRGLLQELQRLEEQDARLKPWIPGVSPAIGKIAPPEGHGGDRDRPCAPCRASACRSRPPSPALARLDEPNGTGSSASRGARRVVIDLVGTPPSLRAADRDRFAGPREAPRGGPDWRLSPGDPVRDRSG